MKTVMNLRASLFAIFALTVLDTCAITAPAQGDLNVLITPSAADAPTRIYTARKILTMETTDPTATAVAVAGDRILAVGSLEEVKKALADRPFTIDERFADQVLMPA